MADIENEDYEDENEIGLQFTVFSCNLQPIESTSSDNAEDCFLRIPDEIMVHIFSYVPFYYLRKSALVCKRWHKLSLDSKLWEKTSLTSKSLKINSLEQILNCGVSTLQLKCIEIKETTPPTQFYFNSKRFNRLQNLQIINMEIKSTLVEELLSLTPYLKVFKLNAITFKMDGNVLRNLLNLQFLEELNLYAVEIASCSENKEILGNNEKYRFKAIKSLNLSDLLNRSSIETKSLLKLCPSLKFVHLSKVDVMPIVFRQISQMKNLEELRVEKAKVFLNIESDERLNNLRTLCVHDSEINVDSLIKLLHFCPHLQTFSCTSVYINKDVFRQIMFLKNLENLDLRYSTMDSPSEIIHALKNFEGFNKLNYLCLIMCTFLTLELLDILLQRCFYISRLKITYVDLNEAIFRQILRMSSLKTLEIIGIISWENFRISSTFEKHNTLEELMLTYDAFQSSVSVNEIVLSSCPNITSLYLKNCSFSKNMFRIILKMEQLQELKLYEIKIFNEFSKITEITDHNRLHKLQCLVLCYKKFHTNAEDTLVLLSAFPHINVLGLKHCLITEEICRHIASMTQLKYLDLHYVKGSLSYSFSDNLKTYPKFKDLQSFNIVYEDQEASPSVLEGLLPLCSYARSMHLQNIHLTDKICRYISEMNNLHKLILSHASGITRRKINGILSSCPNLTSHDLLVQYAEY